MRIFEYFLFAGEDALLFCMIDYQKERILQKTELDLMIFMRTDMLTTMIEEVGVHKLLE